MTPVRPEAGAASKISLTMPVRQPDGERSLTMPMWQKLLKFSGDRKRPAVSQPYDRSVAIGPQITTPVWPTPEKPYDAKSAILTMSKKFVTPTRPR